MKKIFFIVNPLSGQLDYNKFKTILKNLEKKYEIEYTLHESTKNRQMKDLVRSGIREGCDVFAAVGGDGTVSGVASGLVNEVYPLGIVPVGTGNVLAKTMGIPLEIEHAAELLIQNSNVVRKIDSIFLDGQVYLLNVSMGASAMMMRDTGFQEKRKFGQIAYLFEGLKKLGRRYPKYSIMIGSSELPECNATDVLVANSAALGHPYLKWSDRIRADDGKLDVFIIRAKTFIEYLKTVYFVLRKIKKPTPEVKYFQTKDSIEIKTDKAVPVQGDGDFIGYSPVKVQPLPRSVHLIVPSDQVNKND